MAELSGDRQKVYNRFLYEGFISSKYDCPERGKNVVLTKSGGLCCTNYEWVCCC